MLQGIQTHSVITQPNKLRRYTNFVCVWQIPVMFAVFFSWTLYGKNTWSFDSKHGIRSDLFATVLHFKVDSKFFCKAPRDSKLAWRKWRAGAPQHSCEVGSPDLPHNYTLHNEIDSPTVKFLERVSQRGLGQILLNFWNKNVVN